MGALESQLQSVADRTKRDELLAKHEQSIIDQLDEDLKAHQRTLARMHETAANAKLQARQSGWVDHFNRSSAIASALAGDLAKPVARFVEAINKASVREIIEIWQRFAERSMVELGDTPSPAHLAFPFTTALDDRIGALEFFSAARDELPMARAHAVATAIAKGVGQAEISLLLQELEASTETTLKGCRANRPRALILRTQTTHTDQRLVLDALEERLSFGIDADGTPMLPEGKMKARIEKAKADGDARTIVLLTVIVSRVMSGA